MSPISPHIHSLEQQIKLVQEDPDHDSTAAVDKALGAIRGYLFPVGITHDQSQIETKVHRAALAEFSDFTQRVTNLGDLKPTPEMQRIIDHVKSTLADVQEKPRQQ